jgi:hypothetical protein
MWLAADFLLRTGRTDVGFRRTEHRADADDGSRVLPRRLENGALTYVTFSLQVRDVVTGGRERALVGAQAGYTDSDEICHLSAP